MTEKVFKPHPKFQKISEEWRKKWSDALRSGNYKQGKDCLYKSGRYCCLGVLQDIHGKPVKARNGSIAGTPWGTSDPVKMECQVIATDSNTEENFDGAGLNDGQNLTFTEIADLIDGKEVVVQS